MKPAPFDLHRPATVADAAELLAEHGDDAKVLAGGQSLVPLLALRLATPAHVVDITGLESLRAVERVDGTMRIGAGVTHAAVGMHSDVRAGAPLLARAVAHIGHPAIRNRGTIGGSIAHADPAAEYPAVCVALGAELEATSASGVRRIAADRFFAGTYQTVLRADEMLMAISVPVAGARSGSAIDEIAWREGDFALAGAACSIDLDASGRVARAGLALFGVADQPVAAAAAAAALVGRADLTDRDVDEIGALAVADLEPRDTIHASGRYLRHVARLLAARVVQRSWQEARDG